MKIYRKRYLPEELLWLKDDEILLADDEKIITAWRSIKPRPDFSHGISCYFLHKNYKISKFFDSNGRMIYYYCDIVKAEVDGDKYIFCDLLVDVVVFSDGSVKVLDTDELAEAFEKGEVSGVDVTIALKALNSLLKIVYNGNLAKEAEVLDIYGSDER
ncbi:MAG: DUF402 domain-containing protein [Defluviitaleaceae bacterium]|nr:DUF402 domain-containing protein [Defluviitaleaceae bacterium]